MKKILFLAFILFVSTEVFARCAGTFNKSKCPTTICSEGTFMGDDGKCYDCNEISDIDINCMGDEKASKVCPNRISVHQGCGYMISRLCPENNCQKGTFMGDDGKCYSCDEEKEIEIACIGISVAEKSCLNRIARDCYGFKSSLRCREGYNRDNSKSLFGNSGYACCNGKECYYGMCPDY